MPQVPATESSELENTSRKRALENTEDFPSKKKSWGILTSQVGFDRVDTLDVPCCVLAGSCYLRAGLRCVLCVTGSWADRSPLHEAAARGRLLTLRHLISQGYNVDVRTIDHVTPLHEACLADHVACARTLIDAGANVNATTIDGVTPLFNSCMAGSATCAEILLENGASPQTAICQPSPIHEATSKGANVQKGRFLETPLHAAAEKDCADIVRVLLEYGADVNVRNQELKRPVESAPPSSLAEGFLLLYEAMPRPLCQLCRLSIRDCIGQSRLHLIPQLQLPNRLKNFLQYR
ncbi:ankyrin repeat and SOCS box protein 5-like isoform X4 [Anguilla rostrata]|uniref:ankyrin repeat and SOCS box protein 5-like isoform X4 n=1 Tax=Anguilla rostrata TaxID=7938 RepID=UPI0030CC4B4B